MRCRLFQQAIEDIIKACELDPNEGTYHAEKALIYVRVNMLDEGMQAAKECIEKFPDYGDGHAILGLALIQKGKKKEGLAELEKAKSLNSQMAQPLIEKYGK